MSIFKNKINFLPSGEAVRGKAERREHYIKLASLGIMLVFALYFVISGVFLSVLGIMQFSVSRNLNRVEALSEVRDTIDINAQFFDAKAGVLADIKRDEVNMAKFLELFEKRLGFAPTKIDIYEDEIKLVIDVANEGAGVGAYEAILQSGLVDNLRMDFIERNRIKLYGNIAKL